MLAPRGKKLSCYSMFSVPVVRIKVLKTRKSTGYGSRKPPLRSQDILEDSHGVELTKTRDFVLVKVT